jgi:hypothetical protein
VVTSRKDIATRKTDSFLCFESIDDEWQRNLLAARPELASQIALTHAMMHRAIPDALRFWRAIWPFGSPDRRPGHNAIALIALLLRTRYSSCISRAELYERAR